MSFDAKEYHREWYKRNKEAQNARSKKRYEENKEHYSRNATANARLRRFGIDQEAFDFLLELQEYKCHLCKSEIGASADTDHDHDNNRVRGLLCRRCNQGLGLFKDNTKVLLRAADYIKRNK